MITKLTFQIIVLNLLQQQCIRNFVQCTKNFFFFDIALTVITNYQVRGKYLSLINKHYLKYENSKTYFIRSVKSERFYQIRFEFPIGHVNFNLNFYVILPIREFTRI